MTHIVFWSHVKAAVCEIELASMRLLCICVLLLLGVFPCQGIAAFEHCALRIIATVLSRHVLAAVIFFFLRRTPVTRTVLFITFYPTIRERYWRNYRRTGQYGCFCCCVDIGSGQYWYSSSQRPLFLIFRRRWQKKGWKINVCVMFSKLFSEQLLKEDYSLSNHQCYNLVLYVHWKVQETLWI